jgi:hypothetical protein
LTPSALSGVREPFRALVVTFVPDAAGLTEEGWAKGEALVERMLTRRRSKVRRQIRLLIRVLDVWARVRTGRGLAQLDPARRTRMLERLEDSALLSLRRGVWGLRTLAFLLYYGRSEGRAAVGYGASPLGWEAER